MRYTDEIKTVVGNGQIGTVSAEMPIGPEYFRVILENKDFGGADPVTSLAVLTELEVNINGENTWPLTINEVDEMNKADGLGAYATDGIVILDFENQKFIDGAARQATSINTGQEGGGRIIGNFSIAFKQSVAGNWRIKATFGDPDPLGPGVIKRFQKFKETVGAATGGDGKSTNQILYADSKHALIRRLFLRAVTGGTTIDRVKIFKGANPSKKCLDRLAVENTNCLVNGGKIPGAYYSWIQDFCENNMPDHLNTLGPDFFNEKTGKIASALGVEVLTNADDDVIYIVESNGVVA